MKHFTLLLFTISLFTLANCSKNAEPEEEPICTGDCVFIMKDAPGTMIKMACFNRYAIKTHHPQIDSVFIYGIPDVMDAKFEEEGKTVTFSGTFRPNVLTPTFPDPSFSPDDIYQMKVTDIR